MKYVIALVLALVFSQIASARPPLRTEQQYVCRDIIVYDEPRYYDRYDRRYGYNSRRPSVQFDIQINGRYSAYGYHQRRNYGSRFSSPPPAHRYWQVRQVCRWEYVSFR